MAEEELNIIEIVDPKDRIPKLINRKTETPVKMETPKAIVLHQDTAVRQSDMELVEYLTEENISDISYNFYITPSYKIMSILEPPACSRHIPIPPPKYSSFATNYFGPNLAPSYNHTKTTPHLNSPNSATISICIPRLDERGFIDELTLNVLTKLLAYVINKYANILSPVAYEMKKDEENKLIDDESTIKPCNILKYSELIENSEKSRIAHFFEKPDTYHRLLLDVDKLCKRWAADYKKHDPRYPKDPKKMVSVGYPTTIFKRCILS